MTEPNADLIVDPDQLRTYATVTLGYDGDGQGVIDFLRRRQDVLRTFEANAEENLKGGFGKTGGYQKSLAAFGGKFSELLREFDKEHEKLCVFLETLREKMLQSAQAYQEVEGQNVQKFSSIRQRLDSGRG